jgi:hypothetical protein
VGGGGGFGLDFPLTPGWERGVSCQLLSLVHILTRVKKNYNKNIENININLLFRYVHQYEKNTEHHRKKTAGLFLWKMKRCIFYQHGLPLDE